MQTQEACLRHGVVLEIFADLGSHSTSDWLVESGECVQCRLVMSLVEINTCINLRLLAVKTRD